MTRGRALRLACGGLASLMLAACASAPPAEPASSWTSGRLAVRVAASADLPARSEAAAFELRGNGDAGELRLLTPLGTVVASARWWPGQVVLTTPQGQARFDDLDQLSRDTFGDVLPLRALADWIAGRPWPGAPSQASEGGFEQLGWRVTTADLSAGSLLAQRQAAPVIVVRVRLDG